MPVVARVAVVAKVVVARARPEALQDRAEGRRAAAQGALAVMEPPEEWARPGERG
jgi:hypothetical protein